jgi:glycerophosphoryl diester phosphodiesterase
MEPRTPRPPAAAGRPLVLGHRGASAEAPENTLAAFRLALEQGADGVELDVWRCASGEVVVFHDADARRLAGSPLRVARATLAELRRLDVGSHRGERFRGERIPLLGEVLEELPGAVVNVELKAGRVADPRLAAEVARVLGRQQAGERVVVSSFDTALLAAFRLAAPKVAAGLLFDEGRFWRNKVSLAALLLRPAALHPPLALATPERVRDWIARGYGVNVWTVDAPADVERLCGLGVTAVISNAPGRARQVVRRETGR